MRNFFSRTTSNLRNCIFSNHSGAPNSTIIAARHIPKLPEGKLGNINGPTSVFVPGLGTSSLWPNGSNKFAISTAPIHSTITLDNSYSTSEDPKSLPFLPTYFALNDFFLNKKSSVVEFERNPDKYGILVAKTTDTDELSRLADLFQAPIYTFKDGILHHFSDGKETAVKFPESIVTFSEDKSHLRSHFNKMCDEYAKKIITDLFDNHYSSYKYHQGSTVEFFLSLKKSLLKTTVGLSDEGIPCGYSGARHIFEEAIEIVFEEKGVIPPLKNGEYKSLGERIMAHAKAPFIDTSHLNTHEKPSSKPRKKPGKKQLERAILNEDHGYGRGWNHGHSFD